jgi:alkylhydroperoxidase family enzyme
MPHIPYIAPPPPGESALVDAIRERRGGRLLNLDLMLLHSPPFASGWNTFLREVRQHLSLDPVLRELAICHIALLNGADYEYAQHAPEFLAVGGLQSALDRLQVDAERMLANLDSSHGLVFSQSVLLALVQTGLDRDEAYRIVQTNALRAWDEDRDFRTLLMSDPAVASLGVDVLDAAFSLERSLRYAQQAVDSLDDLLL